MATVVASGRRSDSELQGFLELLSDKDGALANTGIHLRYGSKLTGGDFVERRMAKKIFI